MPETTHTCMSEANANTLLKLLAVLIIQFGLVIGLILGSMLVNYMKPVDVQLTASPSTTVQL